MDEVAVVKDEWDELLFKDEELREPSEPTRGDVVPEEYAWGSCARASDGNLSFAYNGRCAA